MNKKNNKGCGSAILGTLAVILAVAAFALLSSQISRIWITARFGDTPAVALLTFSITAVAISFFFFEAVFIAWQIKLSVTAAGDTESAQKMSMIVKIILIACVCLSLLLAVFSANTYIECGEESISKVCFVKTKEYRWSDRNDVLRYTFSCDESGGLTFNITMKDGEVISLLGSANTLSNAFREKYDTGNANLLSYAAMLADSFDSSDYIIEKKINGQEHMEKFYKDNRPEVWVYMEQIIN